MVVALVKTDARSPLVLIIDINHHPVRPFLCKSGGVLWPEAVILCDQICEYHHGLFLCLSSALFKIVCSSLIQIPVFKNMFLKI